MGTISGTTLINKAAALLYDANNIKWSRAELLGWLSGAQRALVVLLPDASSTRASVQMVAGPRQTIPTTAWLLLEVTSNMGVSGTARGRSLQKVDRATLDQTNPTWYSDPAVTACALYMYDGRDRTAFDVYPPSDGTGYVEIIYSAMPADMPTEATAITVNDLYEPALVNYIMFRAKSKSAEFANPAEAKDYLASFRMYVESFGTAEKAAAGAPE